VGVNSFKLEDETLAKKTQTLKISPELEKDQIARLKAFKAKRNLAAAEAALTDLRAAAQAKVTTNMFPAILRCVENAATLGEICDTLRKEFGEYSAG
jgi:methylmalonyl-CoA mutase N-terminal domain/subunit